MAEMLGQRIARLRKQCGITQEAVAEKLGVSPQAVSKWENDISCPDIQLLGQLAQLLRVTTDELLSGKKEQLATLVPEARRRPAEEMVLRILVDSGEGDHVKMNLPLGLVKLGLSSNMFQVNGMKVLEGIDINRLLELVEKGVMGKLVEVDSADGAHVEIVVE